MMCSDPHGVLWPREHAHTGMGQRGKGGELCVLLTRKDSLPRELRNELLKPKAGPAGNTASPSHQPSLLQDSMRTNSKPTGWGGGLLTHSHPPLIKSTHRLTGSLTCTYITH